MYVPLINCACFGKYLSSCEAGRAFLVCCCTARRACAQSWRCQQSLCCLWKILFYPLTSAVGDLAVTRLLLKFQLFGKYFETLVWVWFVFWSLFTRVLFICLLCICFALLLHFGSCIFLFSLITHKPLIVTRILNKRSHNSSMKRNTIEEMYVYGRYTRTCISAHSGPPRQARS